MCVILQVVLLLVCRAHKPNFFCSSGDQIVTTVTVSEWYCEKSTFSACGDLALKEISVAIYLFSKGSLMAPLPSPPPPKKKRKHMESVNFLLQNFKYTSSLADVPMLENVKCSVGHVACQV